MRTRLIVGLSSTFFLACAASSLPANAPATTTTTTTSTPTGTTAILTPTPSPSPSPSSPGAGSAAPPAVEVLATPSIELGAPDHAIAFGQGVTFDGASEGLYWPALSRAFAAKAKGAGRVVLAAPRDTRTLDVLRAVWTLREVDVELQTLGPGNEVRPLVLAKRPQTKPEGPTCHAAVFLGEGGALRVAVPDGPASVRDTAELVATLAHDARTCTVRWIAVGAESPKTAWGGVFDVAYTVQASRVVENARIVLGEPIAPKDKP